MRKIIFLDFDGVLHPDGEGLFSQLGLFEKHILTMPDIEIVISSTWREDKSLHELQNYFSESIRSQITGTTPILEDGYDTGGRQREIHAFLEAHDLSEKNCHWVALDDMQMFFDGNYPNLILTDSSKGFTEENGATLLQWYNNTNTAR